MKDKNKQLMLDCGSKKGEYDIEAPDQWRFVLRHAKDPLEKAMAWVKSKTTAYLHESPFCVDEHGNPVYAEHMAAELGWKLQTARNIIAILRSQGRLRTDEGGGQKAKRIWYCADVPQAYGPLLSMPVEEEPAEEEGEEEQETVQTEGRRKSDGCNSVHSCQGTYVTDFIKGLPKEKAKVARGKIEAFSTWKREFMADGEAALRSIADRVEDTTLLEIGVPKKRLPKRREAEVKWVQLSLLAEPNFVQSCVADFVQNGNGTSYKPKSNPVQSDSSFIDPTATQPTTTDAPTPAAAPVKDHVVVVEKLKASGIGWVGKSAAQKILDDCQKLVPDCTVEEVATVAAIIAPKINQQTQRNPEAALIKVVPQRLLEYRESKPAPQPTKEQKAVLDAQAVLANPTGFDDESIEWAQGVLGKLAKGAHE